ncbi:MAG: hypothetical protein HLUCCO17_09490 [Saliniramus fredricksonii]|uniref:Uncharacterized protein n=1 Tax=Saliniramus fredricksonii TaxID=1653334 RepID=A0A0P7XTQ0_9HYPH|nr:hypothetical protein [Saliniramus fredricksonii]KPQ10912.1 MAG: hypothetical protein HLUCCO17_09490 [Saliniramus fredricksonii]SCC81137.1 hypothetical protein GA0071312_2070 [Saliniramus fredricksonii]
MSEITLKIDASEILEEVRKAFFSPEVNEAAEHDRALDEAGRECLKVIKLEGEDGIYKRGLAARCASFRKLSRDDREVVIARLQRDYGVQVKFIQSIGTWLYYVKADQEVTEDGVHIDDLREIAEALSLMIGHAGSDGISRDELMRRSLPLRIISVHDAAQVSRILQEEYKVKTRWDEKGNVQFYV